MKKILAVLATIGILVLILLPFTSALAVLSDITDVTANPSNTSIILTWIKVTGSTNTLIMYRTDAFPTDNTDGTQAYFGTKFQATVGNNTTGEHIDAGDNITALTPGQAYYFSVWGEDSGEYSATPFHIVMSTLAVAIPSGAQDQPANTLPIPTLPTGMNQDPNVGAFQLEPFTSIIAWFNNSPGGLGMPVDNAWESIAIVGIVGSGFMTYTKIRNFFVAYAVIFLVTFFCVGLHLVQGWLLGIEIVIGMGVWAVEHYLQ
jgi:hypothetical protein